MDKLNLEEILEYIDPGSLSYQDWVNVGMGLKTEGYPVRVWDDWSRQDGGRYHDGECAKKWESFRGGWDAEVTGGTIVQMAKDRGWTPAKGEALSWDSVIGGSDDLKIVDQAWLESEDLREPGDKWDPVKDLTTYLETIFDSDDNVGFVTETWEKEGKFFPTKGTWARTAGQLISELATCKGDLGRVIGDYKPEAGAWIRFNPLDGKGVKNENVTQYRYALVESDTLAVGKQLALIKELELPVAALVYSGGKSVHAIVKIEADTYDEYRKRVNYLYDVCKKNGLAIDQQNRNPSRLSRMPGVIRNGHKQFLIDTNIGKESWQEWREWIEAVNDDLPDLETVASVWDNIPELAPPLIDGILRQGHKMLFVGASKAGKSFLEIELCIAIAEGRSWLGRMCTQGRVLYINLELDRASCLHRFKDVYQALGVPPKNLQNIDVWNLRGRSVPMDKLVPKLIRRAAKQNYIAIILDPIYKVITGDENSADQMAHFCNQFDRICTELGCSVIYCHHHSKGVQVGKRSMDRASGSGVFARDPDALLDMIELELDEDLRASAQVAMELTPEEAERLTAWRIDGTLREFPKFKPIDMFFNYPVHIMDSRKILTEAKAEGTPKPKKSRKERELEKKMEIVKTYEMQKSFSDVVTVKTLAEQLQVSEKTVRRYINGIKELEVRDGFVIRKDEGQN